MCLLPVSLVLLNVKVNTMKKIVLLMVLIVFTVLLKAQKSHKLLYIDNRMHQISDSSTYSTQDIADYINTEFFTKKEKARAIFFWIAENINYDYSDMYSDSIMNSDEILRIRKGVCRDFTKLYSELAVKVGVKTHIITGYTRKKKVINYNKHAWCASLINSTWYLIDPTWGSGYIKNNRYIREINNDYFMVRPDQFIKTHIPFDPLWQFSNYPITKREFHNRKSKSNNRETFFNFTDTLEVYVKQPKIEQLINTCIRIKSNGIASYLDQVNLSHLKSAIKSSYDRINEEQYNLALKYYNEGITLSNGYVDYQNKNYLPYKSDPKVKQMLDNIENTFKLSFSQLKNVKNPSSYLKINVTHLYKSIDIALSNLNDQKEKLDKYLKIASVYRKTLSNNKDSKLNQD